MKLLLHTCCAPCSTYVVDKLRKDGYTNITSYWYNINIQPYTEYKQRLEALITYNKMIDLPLIIEPDYGIREFTTNVINNIDGRCEFCYRSRLEKTVKYAKEHGYTAFSTTLLVSPYQKHELIVKIANELSEKYGIKFYNTIRDRWDNMFRRCYKPTDDAYPQYGGVGVTVCDRWKSFKNYFYDVQKLPGFDRDKVISNELQLDKDEYYLSRGIYDKSQYQYSPETCQWISTYNNSPRVMKRKYKHGIASTDKNSCR